jgi:hypothetical protein
MPSGAIAVASPPGFLDMTYSKNRFAFAANASPSYHALTRNFLRIGEKIVPRSFLGSLRPVS